jgi:hypothetical protein
MQKGVAVDLLDEEIRHAGARDEPAFLPTCLASGSTLCTAEGRPVASCSTWIQA